MSVLGPLLPPGVALAETRGDRDVALHPEEARALGDPVEKRRREFVTGRALAREALAALGAGPVAVGSGPYGEPLWPDGVVGSITHTDGYRACAVSRGVAALGIDAEQDAPLSEGVWADVALGAERGLRAHGLDVVLFSVKEAIYKAVFPWTGRRLGFEDAEVRLGAETFTAGVRGLGELHGRWARRDGLVLAVLAVPSDYLPGP